MPSIANISSIGARTTTAAMAAARTTTSTTMVNFLPGNDARLSYIVNQVASVAGSTAASSASAPSAAASASSSSAATSSTVSSGSAIVGRGDLPTFSPPRIESLVASSAEDLGSFGDVTFDIFDDDDDLYGSPMAFDASEQGLWNGRFVPPPPRPPFFVDEPVLSDGLTTCDLCSWAMPTKSTFMFEGTIEKATELGWPLTLIIVSFVSALLGAIIMIAVVRCRRKKSSNNRNDTHVQWWSRNKRAHANGAGSVAGNGSTSAGSNAHNNNNHLRRSNIYTAHPADSIRGLQPLPTMPLTLPLPMPPTLAGPPAAAAASMLSAVAANGAATTSQQLQLQQQQQQQQEPPHYFHPYHHHHHHHAPPHYPHDCDDEDAAYEEPEYHQPQQLQLHSSNSNSNMNIHINSNSNSISNSNSNCNSNSNSMLSVTSSPVAAEASHWPQAHGGTMVVAS